MDEEDYDDDDFSLGTDKAEVRSWGVTDEWFPSLHFRQSGSGYFSIMSSRFECCSKVTPGSPDPSFVIVHRVH